MATYAAMTPPATVANPPVITVLSSDTVMWDTNGLMRRGASVWPTKMLPAAESVSAPLAPSVPKAPVANSSVSVPSPSPTCTVTASPAGSTNGGIGQ